MVRAMGRLKAGITIGVLGLLWAPLAVSQTVPGRYLWPLEGYTNVSGGFCDWRPGHYHGGIDISTEGREGLPVRAADSGWVMRISTSYWGYGKAVYLRMPDGRIAVYGHLSEFAPKIQKYVENEQYASRRYRQNLFPAPDEIPFARGEEIALTGQTGAGPPHLHFEIRTGRNRPLDPLVVGFEKSDEHKPRLHALLVVPRPPQQTGLPATRINGGFSAREIDFVGKNGSYNLSETPVVTGPVGLAVLADDFVNGTKWVVSPHRFRLMVNDHLIAEVSYDSINYDDTHLIDLERRVDPSPGIAPRAVNLFRYPQNILWHYTTLVDDGWIAPGKLLIPGANVVRIEVADAAGNVTATEFGLMYADGPGKSGEQVDAATADGITAEPCEGGLIAYIPNTAPEPQRVHGAVDPMRTLAELPAGLLQDIWLDPDNVGDTLWIGEGATVAPVAVGWSAVTRDFGGDVFSPDRLVVVRVGPEELYRSTYFRVIALDDPAHEQKPVSRLYELQPSDAAFARAVRLRFEGLTRDAQTEKLAVYRYRGRARGWDFEGARYDDDGRSVGASISRPGQFALLSDTTPPTLNKVRPGRGVTTSDTRPTITFEMFDDLSGIGSDEDVILTIDGQWVPVEYDPEQRVARARPRWNLPPGKRRVEITARDRMGNEETFLRILNIK